jgi:hypothetical protein
MITAYSSGNFLDASKLSWKPSTPYTLFTDSNPVRIPKNSIFIQVEPNTVYKSFQIDSRLFIRSFHTKYKYILTYDDELLRTIPNAICYVYGTSWIKPDECCILPKEYKISSITGTKNYGPGHSLRVDLFARQTEFPLPHTAFRSGRGSPPSIHSGPVLGDSKLPLFDGFQFALVIENSRQHNYFTEKLCDCLITKTIPVYYGCPNIDEYFDTRGWVILDSESVDDALRKMKILTPEWYSTHMATVEANAIEVLKYTDFHRNLDRALCTIQT